MKRTGKKQAFTLIELLVVVSIIALLVSILLPALNQARIVAKQTVCAAHLRGMGVGMQLYANDNKDTPPPSLCDQESTNYYDANRIFKDYRTDGSGWPQPVNLALLMETGALDNPRVYFCPDQAAFSKHDPTRQAEFFFGEDGIWGHFEYPGAGETHRRGDFTYYLHERSVMKLTKVFSRPIVFDIVTNAIEVSHCSGDHQPRGHNALYGDGHVEFRNGNEMYDELLWNIEEWGVYYGSGMAGFPGNFREFVRRLEGLPPLPPPW